MAEFKRQRTSVPSASSSRSGAPTIRYYCPALTRGERGSGGTGNVANIAQRCTPIPQRLIDRMNEYPELKGSERIDFFDTRAECDAKTRCATRGVVIPSALKRHIGSFLSTEDLKQHWAPTPSGAGESRGGRFAGQSYEEGELPSYRVGGLTDLFPELKESYSRASRLMSSNLTKLAKLKRGATSETKDAADKTADLINLASNRDRLSELAAQVYFDRSEVDRKFDIDDADRVIRFAELIDSLNLQRYLDTNAKFRLIQSVKWIADVVGSLAVTGHPLEVTAAPINSKANALLDPMFTRRWITNDDMIVNLFASISHGLVVSREEDDRTVARWKAFIDANVDLFRSVKLQRRLGKVALQEVCMGDRWTNPSVYDRIISHILSVASTPDSSLSHTLEQYRPQLELYNALVRLTELADMDQTDEVIFEQKVNIANVKRLIDAGYNKCWYSSRFLPDVDENAKLQDELLELLLQRTERLDPTQSEWILKAMTRLVGSRYNRAHSYYLANRDDPRLAALRQAFEAAGGLQR